MFWYTGRFVGIFGGLDVDLVLGWNWGWLLVFKFVLESSNVIELLRVNEFVNDFIKLFYLKLKFLL